MENSRCYALTQRGQRCKLGCNYAASSYGFCVPVCKKHQKADVIFDWSTTSNKTDIPVDVERYIDIFRDILLKNNGVDPWVCAFATTALFRDYENYATTSIDEFFNRILKKSSMGECSVCYEETDRVSIPCGHSFCRGCIQKWSTKNFTCPLCRKKLI